MKRAFTVVEVCTLTGLDEECITSFIRREWVSPAEAEPTNAVGIRLDDEDVARIRFIHELENDLGANEEAIPMILHLVDQVCYFREQVKKLKGAA